MTLLNWVPSTRTLTHPSNRQSTSIIVAFILAFVCYSPVAHGQSLAEFKYASEQSQGRKIIPFGDLQGAVKTLHDTQVTKQKAAAGYNSANLLRDKELYVGFQKDVTNSLATAERALSSYRGDNASEKSKLEAEVKKQKDDLKEITEKIKELDRKMKEGLPKWEAVADARIRVREAWREAYDETNDAERNPEKYIGAEPDDDDPGHDQWKKDLADFKRYTAKIKQKIQAGYRSHDNEIEVAEDAVEKLKRGLRL